MFKKEKIQMIIEYRDEIDKIIHKEYHELAQKYDLTLEQYHLMLELDELMLDVDDGIKAPTVGQIAKNISNSQNTVSERITRLENKGYVMRIKDKDDRRISRVVLTEEGKMLLDSIDKQANSRFLADSISNMEEGDIDTLMECLRKLIDQMKVSR
jgi:MarR family transcriptional regulator, organic hydroperoxide resistance regulator